MRANDRVLRESSLMGFSAGMIVLVSYLVLFIWAKWARHRKGNLSAF
jgi:hypothetical protein